MTVTNAGRPPDLVPDPQSAGVAARLEGDAAVVGLEDVGRAGDLGATAHYEDPAYYSKAYRARLRDVDFYLRLAKASGGPVLEYGVGNGRIALPIARAGVSLVGIDLSRSMLDDLRARLAREPAPVRNRLELIEGDMREVRLERRFPLIMAAFNTFLHLYDRLDVEAFLARVRSHLQPAGRFVFDVSVPSASELSRDPLRDYGSPRIRHPSTGQLTRYKERFEYDPLRQLLLVHMRFLPESGKPWTVPLTHRQFFPCELEALLHYNGFTDLRFTQDFTEDPATASTDSMVVSCSARTDGA